MDEFYAYIARANENDSRMSLAKLSISSMHTYGPIAWIGPNLDHGGSFAMESETREEGLNCVHPSADEEKR
jgi:hypothetical protein